MVFDISTAHGLIWHYRTFKFAENLFIGFAQNIREYVQTAPVRHSDNDLMHVIVACRINDCIKAGISLPPRGKALLTNVFL
jgi:hypothetical protein